MSDKQILQELARRYAELAALAVQEERRQRAQDINDLKSRRPIVWLDEIPWHEMDIDGKLELHCEDTFAREAEWFFRQALYRWEYIQADMVIEPYFPIQKAYSVSNIGINVLEDQLAVDNKNHIVSHRYIDQLDSMEKVLCLKEPEVEAHPDTDAKNLEWAADMFGDILPARLMGHYYYHAPWDVIPRYRGVTAVMMDLIDQPQLMHATIKKFTDHSHSVIKQMKALSLYGTEISSLHCTPGYVSGGKTWFRSMAQMFTEISPEMWQEFDLDYLMPLAKEFDLTYYGCCEAMDRKFDRLVSIPNLRKVGVPARSNPELMAEFIGKDYVYAHKPNPAHVSGTFDPETVRKEIATVISACQKNSCAYEFVLKDISTVGYKPQNLIDWVKIVMETIDKG